MTDEYIRDIYETWYIRIIKHDIYEKQIKWPIDEN